MSRTPSRTAAALALTVTLLLLGLLAIPAGAHPTAEPDCDGERWAVVAAEGDAAMAELIASRQVLDTDCVVTPDRVDLIDGQRVVVLGGTAAVSSSAVAGLAVEVRLAGADRVETARAVLEWIDERNGEATPEPEQSTADSATLIDHYWSADGRKYFVELQVPSDQSYCRVDLLYNGRRTGDWSNELRYGGGRFVIDIFVDYEFDEFEWECS